MNMGVRCAAAAISLFWATAAQALEYSADAVFHDTKGAVRTDKIFVSSPKVRIQPAGESSFEILDVVQQTGWIVVPGKSPRVIRDMIASQRGARYAVGPNLCVKLSIPTQPATCTKIGTDKVNGSTVEKWQFNRSVQGHNIIRTLWIDRRLDALVKVQSGSVTSFELQNVRLGPQPAGLFAVPAMPQKPSSPQK